MYHSDSGVVGDHSSLQWTSVEVRTDEERDRRIIRVEGSQVMSQHMQHVLIDGTVLVGARLNVHLRTLRPTPACVNIY